MSAELLARLIAAGTPADLVGEVAMALATAQAQADAALNGQPSAGALRMRRYRERGGDQVPGHLRLQVFERDGFACVDCGSTERLECDHVIPVAKGGDSSFENLQTLCRSCNARKRDRIRKRDERGQSRTISDNGGHARTSADVLPEFPSPDKSPPDPQKLTPTPHTHEGPAPDAPATPRAWACPAGVDPGHWRDFRANRRKKRLTDTETAYAAQLRLLARFATAEWPPGRLVEKAAEKGWGTIVDPSEYEDQSNGHRPGNHRQHHARTGSNGLLDAVLDAERAERFGPRH